MTDTLKQQLAEEAYHRGWRVLNSGYPDLLLFRWEEGGLVEALWVEVKNIHPMSSPQQHQLNDEQFVMLSVMHALGLKVKLSFDGQMDNLLDFNPETLEEDTLLARCRVQNPQKLQPLADATYKKYKRRYYYAWLKQDERQLETLRRRFLLAGRPIPNTLVEEDREKIQSVISQFSDAEKAINDLLDILEAQNGKA